MWEEAIQAKWTGFEYVGYERTLKKFTLWMTGQGEMKSTHCLEKQALIRYNSKRKLIAHHTVRPGMDGCVAGASL